MAERELKENEEILIGDVGDKEFSNTGKTKKIKRLIIFSIIILVIVAIILIIVLSLKKSDDDKYDILLSDSKFKKPKIFLKQYEYIKIKDSKYKFFLVHDPKTLTAGIEFRTNFGFTTDIIDGFAHYAEHVFFEGTEEINEYNISNLVDQYDEFNNAYTYYEETVFQFLGAQNTFETLLDYISKFIDNPVLNETKFMTEINAVTSEHDSYNTSWRTESDILMENSNPKHGLSQTKTGHIGDNKTIGIFSPKIIGDYLRNYFRTIFKPENCVFLLYSSLSLEEMREYAQKYFNFKLKKPSDDFNELFNKKIKALDNPIYTKDQLGKFIVYNASREIPILMVVFQITEKKKKYIDTSKIMNYLLKGKEEGSLQYFLLKNNYISGLFCYNDGDFRKYELLEIFFDLTKNGIDHIDIIIKALFAYINVIKEDKKMDELLENAKLIDQMNFKNKEEKMTVLPDDIDNILYNNFYYGEENILGNPIDEFYSKKRIEEVFKELSPDNCLIIVDTPYKISSSFLTSSELNYTKNFNTPYKMNKIPKEILEILKNIKSIDDEYEFKPREKNKDYTTLENLTEEPCYKNSYKNCKYNEYDPENSKRMEPYEVTNSENVLSLLKIDRSFGIPFVKGYIDIELDEIKYKKYVNSKETRAQYFLLLYSLFIKIDESSLLEAGSTIDFDFYISQNIIIYFSTYNDLVNKVIDFIINFFNEPIDEITFNTSKEIFYIDNSNNNEDSFFGLRYEIIDIFKDFITAKTYEYVGFSNDVVEKIKYSDFIAMQNNIKSMISKLKYLTYGDISLELAQSTTEKLSSLIKEQDLTLKLTAQQFYDIPEKTSLFYSLTSDNIYQKQGGILVMYEFDEILYKKMELYSICAKDILFNYIRTERGSGYVVSTTIREIYDKNTNKYKYYLSILCIGKVYSPEQMDRLINEAIKESFSYNFPIDLISQHLEDREKLRDFPEEKYYDLIDYYLYGEVNSIQNLKIEEENLTYAKIIEDLKDVLVNKPKRVAILYHRGDITEEELEKQKNELDKNYYLNSEIRNIVTENIQYLKNSN